MTESNPRRPWPVIAAVAAAVVLLVVVIVALAGGGDDDAVAGGTTTPASTSVDGDDAAATTSTAPGAASTTTPAPATTAPTTAPQPATTAPGDGTTAGSDPSGGADATADDPGAPTTTPAPGSLVTVPTGTLAIADPIPPDEVGEFGTGVTAEIVTVEAVEGIAQSPGEIAGPALRVRVKLTNGTDDPVNLSRVLVDVTYGPDRTPGLALAEPGGEPFIGELAAGRDAEGVYVFGIPVDERDQVQISVSYDVDAPILVFEGPAPRG